MYKLATYQEMRAACALIYKRYVQAGFIEINLDESYLLPLSTVMFVSKQQGEVVGTMALTIDSELGLPMELSFSAEVSTARAIGKVAEVGCLVLKEGSFRKQFLGLAACMAQYAREHDVDVLLIAVHPKHTFLYEKFMGFEVVGASKPLPAVQGKLAVPCRLEFARVDRVRPPYYSSIFGKGDS
jgi:hypothetical protein